MNRVAKASKKQIKISLPLHHSLCDVIMWGVFFHENCLIMYNVPVWGEKNTFAQQEKPCLCNRHHYKPALAAVFFLESWNN